MGRFYANLAFDPAIPASYANLLLKLLARLTFGQLRVLAALGDDAYLETLIQVERSGTKGLFDPLLA